MLPRTMERGIMANRKRKMAVVENLNGVKPVAKLDKFDDDVEEGNDSLHESISDLSQFKLDKILSNNTNRKVVCLKGNFQSATGDAIIILEKTAFSDDNLKEDSEFFKENSLLKKNFHNDIYGDYKYYPHVDLNTVKATIIHPATQKHIEKYSIQNCYMLNESPTIYEEIVLPSITSSQFNLQWVYNILEHTSESERIVFEDTNPETGFVLLPDLKWNGEIDTLYLLAITHKRSIKSLRDLNETHLPMLKNIQEEGIKAIESKYGLDGSQLRIYLHYQPSFYHLHVHFTYLRHEAPGILAERAHMLSNVISNIELVSDYYQRVTIPFIVRENDSLFDRLEGEHLLKRIEVKV